MDPAQTPTVAYPCRVPLKVIGKEQVLEPGSIARLILEHLGPQSEADRVPSANRKGAYISYTFWVVLPNAEAERPLREAIHRLPGCMMQL